MTAEQLPDSNFTNLELTKKTSTELEFAADVNGQKLIFEFIGAGIDTRQDPLIFEYNIYDGNRNLLLLMDNFTHSLLNLDRMLSDGADSSELLIGNDLIWGDIGNDVLTGFRGSDDMWGDAGDDLIRAGNGADEIWGDTGSDVLYGGFGRNLFLWEDDGAFDELYFKSDQWAYNYIYDSARNNPYGAKADTIYSLDSFDRIYIQGVSTSDLSFANVDGGIGIFAGGYLEATYTGGNLSAQQLQSMTSGVAS